MDYVGQIIGTMKVVMIKTSYCKNLFYRNYSVTDINTFGN
jgi:hypothetical protein